MPKATTAHSGRLVLLFWILVAFFYFFVSYDYIRTSMNDQAFADYLEYVVQIAGNDHRPSREIQALILVKSEELGLPVRGDQISIAGEGASLRVSVDYEADIEIPIFERGVYRKLFQHAVGYSTPR